MVFNSLECKKLASPICCVLAHSHFQHITVHSYISLLAPSALTETEKKGNNDSLCNHMLLSVPTVVDNGAEKSSGLIKWIH